MREPERPRVAQGGGQDLGDLLGRVGGRAARAGHVVQAGEALEVESPDPAVDGGPGDAEPSGGGGDFLPGGQGGDDPGPLDGAGRCGSGAGQVLDGLPLRGG